MKEEILRAIEAMQYLDESSRGILFKSLTGKEEREQVLQGIRIATRLLQEQLNRLDGCEVCNSNYKPISQYVGFYPKRAEIEIKDAADGDVQIDIKCCPICGRKLRGGEDE